MPNLEYQVSASGDDGRRYSGAWAFSAVTKNPQVGYKDDGDRDACANFFRFDNVAIPVGATITDAYLEIYANDGVGVPRLKIYAVDEDDAAAPTSAAEYDADPQTAAAIDWDGTWTADQWETSPQIKTVIQEIVDRGGWASGQAICIQIEDDLGSGDNYNEARHYDENSAQAAKLFITYTEAALDIDETIQHETGDLSEYDSTASGGGGSITASTSGGLGGTEYGLAIVTAGTGSESYGQVDVSAPSSNEYGVRFYLDPNTMNMANGDNFVVHRVHGTADWISSVRLIYSTASGYYLDIDYQNDASAVLDVGTATITDGEHYIEYLLARASGSASSDGAMTVWIDGAASMSHTSSDNYDLFATLDNMKFGSTQDLDAGTNGTFYLDEIRVTSDGAYIGPRVGRCRKSHLRQGCGLGAKIGSSKR